MDRKKAPHKLQVEDSKQDDNSIVEMTQAKMDELKIFRGDAVILKGKSNRKKNRRISKLLAKIDRFLHLSGTFKDTEGQKFTLPLS